MLVRRATKRFLGLLRHVDRGPAQGVTLLTYHRVGGGTGDELDLPVEAFRSQVDVIRRGPQEVVGLATALDRLEAGDASPCIVLTFDDGFAEMADVVLPVLEPLGVPFTLYLAAGLVGGSMRWEGSAASSQGAPALSWTGVEALHRSGLCTIGNHTFGHSAPSETTEQELDRCSAAVEEHLGFRPEHFAWTWGVPVPELMPQVRERFRSVATGAVGRNRPGEDVHSLRRVPVRSSDPPSFFEAKLTGRLAAERTYGAVVRVAKRGRGVVGS